MAGEACVFCKIVAGQIPSVKVYEDADVLAFMDIGPLSDGHLLVVPKQHFEKLDECSEQVLSSLINAVGKLSSAVKQSLEPDGYNVLCNNGRAAGQLVDHVHFHIIPRKKEDGLFNRWPACEYPKGKAEELAEKIRSKI